VCAILCVKSVQVTNVSLVTRNSRTAKTRAKVDDDIRKASNTSASGLMINWMEKRQQLTKVCTVRLSFSVVYFIAQCDVHIICFVDLTVVSSSCSLCSFNLFWHFLIHTVDRNVLAIRVCKRQFRTKIASEKMTDLEVERQYLMHVTQLHYR